MLCSSEHSPFMPQGKQERLCHSSQKRRSGDRRSQGRRSQRQRGWRKLCEGERGVPSYRSEAYLGSIDGGEGGAQNHYGFGDCTAAGKRSPPMSAGLLDGHLEFLLLHHPMP